MVAARARFHIYGGLHRSRRLMVKPAVHLSDEMLEDRVNAGAAAARARVTHRLFDCEQLVATSSASLAFARRSPGRTVQTLLVPRRLTVELDDAGVAPVDGDLLFVRATAFNGDGRPVPTARGRVTFAAGRDYQLVGGTELELEGGIASALVRTRSVPAIGTISASAQSLGAGRLEASGMNSSR